VGWKEMFSGVNGKLVAIACSLFFIQQLSGINAIVYFSSSVFRDAGIPSEALASASVGVVNVLGTIIAGSLMDKQGRKCASTAHHMLETMSDHLVRNNACS
jgi:MFS family permease